MSKTAKPDRTNEAEGKVTISRVFTKGGVVVTQDGHQEVVVTRRFPDGVRPASVTAACEMKLNLGNYQMATVSAQVTVPCVTEEVEEALVFAYKKAGDHVERIVKEIKGEPEAKPAELPPLAPIQPAVDLAPYPANGIVPVAAQPVLSSAPVPIAPAVLVPVD